MNLSPTISDIIGRLDSFANDLTSKDIPHQDPQVEEIVQLLQKLPLIQFSALVKAIQIIFEKLQKLNE